tara:strand:- start:153 stop:329 length:177 start_codon:yes stop_codon:yes gene_type:complete
MIDTDHPEFTEFEGETLGDTLTNLITEIMRLREGIKQMSEIERHSNPYLVDALKELIE